jgi:hypothetical protein
MDSVKAFVLGEAHRNDEPMVFDWHLAARLIKETGATEASAGLRNDWEWTGGCILYEGKPVKDSYTYLQSTWAVPELELDGGKKIPCFLMKSQAPDWDSGTKWPPTALAILDTSYDL